jgi:hypothetical protein
MCGARVLNTFNPLLYVSSQRCRANPIVRAFYVINVEEFTADISAAIGRMVSLVIRPAAAERGTIDVKTLPASAGTLARFEVHVPGNERAIIPITDHLWAVPAYSSLTSRLSPS